MTARSKFQLKLVPSKVSTVVGGQSKEAVRRGANAVQKRARDNIRRGGRVDTGEMMRKIEVSTAVGGTPLAPALKVSANAKHSIFQEEGTRGSTARPGRFLVFKLKGSGKVIFAKRTKGIKGIHFMRNAARDVKVQDFLP